MIEAMIEHSDIIDYLMSLRRRIWPMLVIAGVLSTAVFLIRYEGRSWWCACGQLFLWTGDVWGRHNSQHFLDPYSVTHVLHGFALCWLFTWALSRLSPAWRLCLAVAIESLWEVIENTDYVIDRYRGATAAIGYEGDTVFNALGDILTFGIGYVLAEKLGFRRSLAMFLVTELLLLILIRDSLILNVIMLLCPIEAIKAWQMRA